MKSGKVAIDIASFGKELAAYVRERAKRHGSFNA
jgi:hypothetical protein